ncbi:hypothetical protein AAY72_01520 [Alishewanella sp. WH16-1]|uniref:hypothetical protein n=1 Tax=Alishewanella sp. WH16-1 TaxID=1651088 RepID=UPI00070D5549|nr:hypothetical protein [Alishewanella sp. WH16-1]KRS22820.1 hypothetical protein AAY72_01520 [Alishewanella sp. WH16-1]
MNRPEDAEQFLRQLGEEGQRALAETLNDAASQLRKDAIDAIHGRYNLERSYVAERISVRTRANPKNLQVTISARVRGTQLARFDAQQQYKPGKTVPERTAGVSVNVVRNNPRATLEQAFFINLKRGNAETGNRGIAIRNSKKRDDFRILYSVSVDQAFGWFRDELEPSSDQLFDDFISRLNL